MRLLVGVAHCLACSLVSGVGSFAKCLDAEMAAVFGTRDLVRHFDANESHLAGSAVRLLFDANWRDHYVVLGKQGGEGSVNSFNATILVRNATICRFCFLMPSFSNANKYAGEAKVVLQKDAEGVVISVLDNGPGIPEEKLETVFEPYYRLESSRNSTTGGTGLGLCITRNMAALNGAELTLTNREEGGLCAQVRFLRR